VTSLVLGIVSLPLCILFVPGAIAVAFSWAADHVLGRRGATLGGAGYLRAGRSLGGASLLLGLLFWLIVPSLGRAREGFGRTYCPANIRGVMQSMTVYAADNGGLYPLVPYAPYTSALNSPTSTVATSPDGVPSKERAIAAMLVDPLPAVAGSPVANVWLLVLRDYVSPKQFVCKSDPFATGPAPLLEKDGYRTNISAGGQLSYSFAYPWTADGKPAPWTRTTEDATLPLMSDMAPLQGTGTPARVLNPAVAPADDRTWSSASHDGKGQTVGFADVHVEWARTPTVGHDGDNIFTTTGTGAPARFGGVPATPTFPPTPAYPAGAARFDVIFFPVRDATTGAM
jgi:hypothetical protein